jgi:hypothetical protein
MFRENFELSQFRSIDQDKTIDPSIQYSFSHSTKFLRSFASRLWPVLRIALVCLAESTIHRATLAFTTSSPCDAAKLDAVAFAHFPQEQRIYRIDDATER